MLVLQKRTVVESSLFLQDNDAWETNRLLTSGVVTRTEFDEDFDEADEVIHSFSFFYHL